MVEGSSVLLPGSSDVRYWHIADIDADAEHVPS